jgi:type IV pilus assembly protein PilC
MRTFTVKVGTPDGEIVQKEVKADSLTAAREEMRRQGLHIFSAKQSSIELGDLLPLSRSIVTTDRFLLFNQELLALVKAGLPIIQSFDIMLERQKPGRFRDVLFEIREKIQSGVALSDAFASYGSAFPPMYSTSLRSGERSGDLEGVLRRYLKYQKMIAGLRRRVIGALVYPTVLIALSGAMILVMLTYVIPKFSEFYEGFGAELPAFTQLLINVSGVIRSNFIVVLAAIVVAYFVVRQWGKTVSGGEMIDRLKLKIPLAGGVFYRFAILQFTQSLGTLLSGGTPMVPAIEIASSSITNRHVSSRLESIAQKVREGEPLNRSLESTGVVSDLAIQMIKVGESTGALTEMLANVSEFYDEEIEAKLARMISLIEPLILVFLGIVISVLLYAFYLPLFQLTAVGQQV